MMVYLLVFVILCLIVVVGHNTHTKREFERNFIRLAEEYAQAKHDWRNKEMKHLEELSDLGMQIRCGVSEDKMKYDNDISLLCTPVLSLEKLSHLKPDEIKNKKIIWVDNPAFKDGSFIVNTVTKEFYRIAFHRIYKTLSEEDFVTDTNPISWDLHQKMERFVYEYITECDRRIIFQGKHYINIETAKDLNLYLLKPSSEK